MKAAYILLGKPCLYDFVVTSFDWLNTYELKFNGKRIMLKFAQLKPSMESQKIGMVTN